MFSVSSLTVRGYKSIRELNDFPLTNLNVLIGANGAGKSNFISLFRLLAGMMAQRLQLYVPLQGGAEVFLHFGSKTTYEFGAGACGIKTARRTGGLFALCAWASQ